MGDVGRFDIFRESHIGLGIRWRRSVYFTGWDVSFGFPFFTITMSTGAKDHRVIYPD